MPQVYCSLINNEPQEIPSDGEYHLLKFPYVGESYDPHVMHQTSTPETYLDDGAWREDPHSGLIWPKFPWEDGLGILEANVHWEDGDYTELRDRFVRDPLNLTTGYNSTATDHRAPSPGMQCFTKFHQIVVKKDVPLGLMVAQNGTGPRRVVHAQFKLSITKLLSPNDIGC